MVVDESKLHVSPDCIHIEDSYKVPKSEFCFWLWRALAYCPDYKGRTVDDLELEWAAHNLLYKLHVMRSHTKDVDLETPQSRLWRFVWRTFGEIAWHLIA